VLGGGLAVPCRPQPAYVEPNGSLREGARGSDHGCAVLTAEPSAAHAGEPRETRKGAAVSRPLRVLEDPLARACYPRSASFLLSMGPRTGALFRIRSAMHVTSMQRTSIRFLGWTAMP